MTKVCGRGEIHRRRTQAAGCGACNPLRNEREGGRAAKHCISEPVDLYLLRAVIVAAVLHYGLRYRFLGSLDAVFVKVAVGWLMCTSRRPFSARLRRQC